MLRARKGWENLKEPMARYGVQGVPSLLMLEPHGRQIGLVAWRSVDKIVEQLRNAAERWSPERTLRRSLRKYGTPWDLIR